MLHTPAVPLLVVLCISVAATRPCEASRISFQLDVAEDVTQVQDQSGRISNATAAVLAARAKASTADFPIDFAYCWSGEALQVNVSQAETVDNDEAHVGYGLNEMKLSVRALQKFAPWFNKAYVLVNGPDKPPAWAANDPRIVMVDRCSLFPKKSDCPTKNTFACQSVLHLVPGLNEHFVYMEDDYFFVKPVKPSNFFAPDGKPVWNFQLGLGNRPTMDIYGPRKDLSGPDMPPEHTPIRLEHGAHNHGPWAMLKSFAASLEDEFPDYFAFVRSHITRFICCDAKKRGDVGSLSSGVEEFLRMWPAMMHKHNIALELPGDGSHTPAESKLPPATHAPSLGLGQDCKCNDVACIKECMDHPAVMFINFNEQDTAGWVEVRDILLQHMQADETGAIPLWKFGFVAASVGLASWAGWLIYSAARSTGFEIGITTATQATVFSLYAVLSVLHMFLQRKAGATHYSIISATVLIYVGKCVFSFGAFLIRNDFDKHVLEAGGTKFGKWQSTFLLMVMGAVFAGYDALSYVSLHNLDPATYQILVHMRVFFVGVLWQIVFGKTLSNRQWQALLLLVCAGFLKVVARATVLDTSLLIGSIWIMAGQGGLSAFGNVYSEALLKDMASMPTDLVNTIIYFWGLVSLVILLLGTRGPEVLYEELMAPAAWARLWADPWMVSSILCMVVFGICTAYLLKHLSNIVKEMTGALVIVVSTVLQGIFIGLSVITSWDLLAITVAVLSIGVYCTDPVRNGKKLEDTSLSPPKEALASQTPPEA